MQMDTKQLVKIYKALANENRLNLFKEILKYDKKEFEDCCPICHIVDKFKIGAPTISHHLKELANSRSYYY